LEPDGDLGPITRRKIVEEYMAVDGTSLPDGVEVVVHGCGENFPAEMPDPAAPEDPAAQPGQPRSEADQALDRRVELFFFDGEIGVHPPPPGDNSPAGSTVYPHWRRLARETHDFLVRTNTITVRVLLGANDGEGATDTDRPERLRLRSEDGSYDRVMGYVDAIRVSMHHFAVEFEHVPLGAACTLHCDHHGRDTFAELVAGFVAGPGQAACSEGDVCREIPPPPPPPSIDVGDDPDPRPVVIDDSLL
jgi:hypothetical protein